MNGPDLEGVYVHSLAIYCFHLQYRKVSREIKQQILLKPQKNFTTKFVHFTIPRKIAISQNTAVRNSILTFFIFSSNLLCTRAPKLQNIKKYFGTTNIIILVSTVLIAAGTVTEG
jgi:hypothetical protein